MQDASSIPGSGRSPWSRNGKLFRRICLQCRRPRFDPWVGKTPWRKEWLLTPVVLSGESRGERSLMRLQRVGHDWEIECTHTSVKHVNVERDKERLEYSSRLKKTEETWLINAVSDPKLDPESEFFFFLKEHFRSTSKNWNKVCRLDNSIILVLIFWFW